VSIKRNDGVNPGPNKNGEEAGKLGQPSEEQHRKQAALDFSDSFCETTKNERERERERKKSLIVCVLCTNFPGGPCYFFPPVLIFSEPFSIFCFFGFVLFLVFAVLLCRCNRQTLFAFLRLRIAAEKMKRS